MTIHGTLKFRTEDGSFSGAKSLKADDAFELVEKAVAMCNFGTPVTCELIDDTGRNVLLGKFSNQYYYPHKDKGGR